MSNANFDLRMVDAPPETEGSERELTALPESSPTSASAIGVAPTIQALTPYEAISSQAAIEAKPDNHTSFKLDWNECTVAPSPRVNEAISDYLQQSRGLNWYPKLGSTDLVDALVDYTGVPADHLLVTNGSDDALRLICSTYLDRGDRVVIPVPTYNHFMVFVQSRGAEIVTTRGQSAFDPNVAGIEEAMTEDTRLLYLVSPNNPTGYIHTPETVAELCRRYPSTLIVLDEAYFEFSQITGIELVREFPNLLVTRTFSKAFGLAGLRVGYLATSPMLIDGLRRIYNPKSVNTLGQIGAIASLNDLDYLNEFLDEVEASKEILREFFDDHDVDAHITSANFVVVRMPNVKETISNLESRGVYVRDRSSYPGLEGCLRMTVGTREQTRRLLDRIGDLFVE